MAGILIINPPLMITLKPEIPTALFRKNFLRPDLPACIMTEHMAAKANQAALGTPIYHRERVMQLLIDEGEAT